MASDIVIRPDRTATGIPTLTFVGASGSGISLQVLQDGSLSYQGTAGALFGVVDSLSGSLMSVAGVDGLPVFEVFTDRIVGSPFFNGNTWTVSGRNVGLGVAAPQYQLDATGQGRFSGGLVLNSGLTMGSSNIPAGGISWPDVDLYRVSAGKLGVNASTPNLTLRSATVEKAFWDFNGTIAEFGAGAATPLVIYANNLPVISLSTGQVATFSSGIILGTSNVTGGGIAFGSNVNLWTVAAGNLVLSGPGVNTPTFRLNSAGGNGAQISFDNTTLVLGQAPAIGFNTNNGFNRALTLDAGLNGSFSSGLFFADTGNFTSSGAVSNARLQGVSGALAALISASAAGVSTLNSLSGALNIGGINGNSISVSGQTIWVSGNGGAAGGVTSVNALTGALTVASAPGNAGYVGVSVSGSTIFVSGLSGPTLSGVTFAGGGTVSGDANTIMVNAGQLFIPTGRAGAPGLSWQLDPTNGIYRFGSNQWGLVQNGTQTLTLNGNVNVLNANLLVRTSTPSNNGAIQIAAHTTSGAGIGLGPDLALYNSPTLGRLALNGNAGTGTSLRFTSNNYTPWIGQDGDNGNVTINGDVGYGVILRANGGSAALTINSALLATFSSGVVLGITGDYTTNRAASVAQLVGLSGVITSTQTGNYRGYTGFMNTGIDFLSVSFVPAFPGIPAVTASVQTSGLGGYMVWLSGVTSSGYNAMFSATTADYGILHTHAIYRA